MGDPSGVGPEIIASVLPSLLGLASFVIIGDKKVFKKASPRWGCAGEVDFVDMRNVPDASFSFGRVKAEYGRASIEYLDQALGLLKAGAIDCLVTCPICKESVHRAGFRFPGHTEYLAAKSKSPEFVMMLLNRGLRLSLVTRHIPLARVSAAVKKENICSTALITHHSLRTFFSIPDPRIVLCGLNPHASDNGLIGSEENSVLRPAVSKLRRLIRNLEGPLPADAAIAAAARKEFDCAIAMYHDQALIALKLFGNETGVNMTLGLPFVRTSPLHGTAFDIAGKGLASGASLSEAIRLCIECAGHQRCNADKT